MVLWCNVVIRTPPSVSDTAERSSANNSLVDLSTTRSLHKRHQQNASPVLSRFLDQDRVSQSLRTSFFDLSISAPRLGVYYFLSLTLSVCLYVCLFVTDRLQIDSSFLFLDGIEHFWPSFLHVALYKTLFFDFWFSPLTPEIYSPKFGKNRL